MKRTLGIVLIILMVIIPLAGCLASDTGSSEEDDVLIVAMELAYPPFETKDENGDPTGISVDFAKAFGEYIGQEVVIENIAWEGLIPALETGKVDMIISSMTITDEREETVDFSDPYANSLLGILANIDSGIETAEDLNQEGMIIAVKTGSTGFIYAQNSLENAEILSLADESACVAEVTSGKADVFIYDQLTIYRNWQNNLETTEAIFIPFQDVEYWGVAVQEGNTELVTKMNEFIQVYTEEGGFDELTEKYLSEEKEKFDELGFQWFFDLQ
jgi:polar amino acid transport system substrate-binding protein